MQLIFLKLDTSIGTCTGTLYVRSTINLDDIEVTGIIDDFGDFLWGKTSFFYIFFMGVCSIRMYVYFEYIFIRQYITCKFTYRTYDQWMVKKKLLTNKVFTILTIIAAISPLKKVRLYPFLIYTVRTYIFLLPVKFCNPPKNN